MNRILSLPYEKYCHNWLTDPNWEVHVSLWKTIHVPTIWLLESKRKIMINETPEIQDINGPKLGKDLSRCLSLLDF